MCYVCAMDEKKERSYAKESTKSTPSGIRFDLEKLAFIQKRENLATKQKVVDFLLNDYWWKWKVPIVTAKEAPPLDLKLQDTPKPPIQNKPVIQRKTPQQWILDKRDLDDPDEYQKWFNALEADPWLTTREKSAIKQA